MMAHTDDSSPMREARQHGGGRAGAGRLGDLPDRAALGGGELLGDLAGHQREDDAGQHGPEHLEVVDVELGHEEGADDGEQRGEPEARG